MRPVPIGPFVIHSPLGRGGMGEVWLGEYPGRAGADSVPVAIKVIRADRAGDTAFLTAFRSEVRQIALLDHPAIVHVLDAGEVGAEAEDASGGRIAAGSPWLAMEFASGSLATDVGTLDWLGLRTVLLTLLDALGHAHARGVVHLDLKPANVLRGMPHDARPGLKLSDFGLARAVDGQAEGRAAGAGTPRYMAPEQIRGESHRVGPWTDLYALGCMAWELATGHTPFERANAQGVLLAQVKEAPPRLTGGTEVPAGFEAWLLRLLAKDPWERFRHAADAAETLAALGGARAGGRTDTPGPPGGSVPSAFPPGPVGQDMPTWLRPPPPRGSTDAHAATWSVALDLDEDAPEPAAVLRPALPATWRAPRDLKPSLRLTGAGLGLYGMRQPPFVGREAERDAMWAALVDVVRSGKPRGVLLRGAAGQGKTALARWLGEHAGEAGVAGTLHAVHAPIPAWNHGLRGMWARHLRCEGVDPVDLPRRIADQLGATDADGVRDAEALARFLVGEDAETGIEHSIGATERYALLERALARRCGERPVVLVLDDVQWGMDALEFARHLLARASAVRLPVLVVMTARSDALAGRPAESAALGGLLELPGVTPIEVGPLDPASSAALVRELLVLDARLGRRVERSTGGNPFFAIQLVGEWVRRGVLELGSGGFVLPGDQPPPIPDSITRLWRGRLERVLSARPDDARSAIRVAAALGREIVAEEWSAACMALGVAVDPRLPLALVDVGLFDPGPRGWSFLHELLREDVERDTPRAEWAAINRACARMLGDRRTGRDIDSRLGRHFVAAEEWERSLQPLLRGALDRLVESDHASAAELLDLRDASLDALSPAQADPRWGAGWLARIRLHVGLGRFSEANRLAVRTADAARRHGPPWASYLYPALRYRAISAQKSGDLMSAEALLAQAQALADAAGDPGEVARCRLHLGTVRRQQGHLRDALPCFEEARGAFAALGDRLGVADCLAEMAAVAHALSEAEAAGRYLAEALALYEAIGRSVGIAFCRNLQGDFRKTRGDFEGALRAYDEASRQYERAGSHARLFPEINRGLLLLTADRVEEAHAVLAAGLEAARTGRRRIAEAFFRIGLLEVAARSGSWEDWDTHLEEADRVLAETGAVDAEVAGAVERAARFAAAAGEARRAEAAARLAVDQRAALAER